MIPSDRRGARSAAPYCHPQPSSNHGTRDGEPVIAEITRSADLPDEPDIVAGGRGYPARIICPAGALPKGHSGCRADVDLPSFAGRLPTFVLPDKLFEPMGRLVLSAGAVI